MNFKETYHRNCQGQSFHFVAYLRNKGRGRGRKLEAEARMRRGRDEAEAANNCLEARQLPQVLHHCFYDIAVYIVIIN